MLSDVVELAGTVSEMWGALLMANGLYGLSSRWAVPKHLLSALFNGKLARGAGRLETISEEDKVESLRGLAFVALGFLLHVGVKVVSMWLALVQKGAR